MRLNTIFLILIILVSSVFAVTNISGCTNLSTVGETYLINTSFTANQTNCLSVEATGITINGQNNVITSTSDFYHFINASSGIGYTAQNIILSNYTAGFEYGAPSTFTNISMVNTSRVLQSAIAGYPINAGIFRLLSTETGTTASGPIIDIPVNVSNILFENINIEAARPSLGIFAIGTGTGGRTVTLSNSTFTSITMNNINFSNYQGSGNGFSCSTLGLIAASGDGFTPSNTNLTNIVITNYTLSNMIESAGDSEGFGVISLCNGENVALTNMSHISITNPTFINVSQAGGTPPVGAFGVYSQIGILAMPDVRIDDFNVSGLIVSNASSPRRNGIFSYDGNDKGFGVSSTVVNITNSNIIYSMVGNPSSINVLDTRFFDTQITTTTNNVRSVITYTSGQTTTSSLASSITITNGSVFTYTVSDIPVIPPNTDTTTIAVGSYLNLSTLNLNSSSSVTMFYSQPALGENTISAWLYNGTAWNPISSSGTINTTSNTFVLNIPNTGSSGLIGLFAQPAIVAILNSPPSAPALAINNVTFNWSCVGDYGSYLSNLTIDGVVNANATDVAILNGTTNELIVPLGDGAHTWSASCANTTLNSTASSFTIGGGGGGGGGGGSPTPTPTPTPSPGTGASGGSGSGGGISGLLGEVVSNPTTPVIAQNIADAAPNIVRSTYNTCAVRKTGPIEIFRCEYEGILGLLFFDTISLGIILIILFFVLFTLLVAGSTMSKKQGAKVTYASVAAVAGIMTVISTVLVLANNALIVFLTRTFLGGV